MKNSPDPKPKAKPEKTLILLRKSVFETPLGSMVVIADEHGLYLLEFEDARKLDQRIEKLSAISTLIPGTTAATRSIKKELNEYFKGQRKVFETPIFPNGTIFQKKVWNQLRKIPYGQTCSYLDLAKAVGKPRAFRAAASANGANSFPIVIPCHRVINSNGALGGYSSGLERKKWLLALEKMMMI